MLRYLHVILDIMMNENTKEYNDATEYKPTAWKQLQLRNYIVLCIL